MLAGGQSPNCLQMYSASTAKCEAVLDAHEVILQQKMGVDCKRSEHTLIGLKQQAASPMTHSPLGGGTCSYKRRKFLVLANDVIGVMGLALLKASWTVDAGRLRANSMKPSSSVGQYDPG